MGSERPVSAIESETFGQDASFRLEQPVGSMSISPCGRDVVLASREGLHIIDLDSPYSPPRYLPHRTSWEVADVQWSPFASKDYWVVSTSNQKALVWNLATKGWQDAIEFELHAHTRAITDINFSAHHPEILATCAVDSFVHCWDLRDPRRPAFSFSDWFAGATQVKWSRQDSHVLASSHDRYLHIWDDRYGAYPTRSIKAHDTKIYGIDWNRFHPEKIVTCSLDRTVKFWDISKPEDVPDRTIETPFPVWRARHTPFGWGLLVMPQRGSNDLYLYDRRSEDEEPVARPTPPSFQFGGHKGQVKEFLWRARGNIVDDVDHREFQLVSWGADRELRLHRVEPETLKTIGYEKGVTPARRLNFTRKGAKYRTFRDDPTELESPLGPPNHRDSSSVQSQYLRLRPRGSTSVGMSKVSIPQFRGWVQNGKRASRTGMHGKSTMRQDMSAIAWMKNVRIAAWDQETLADEVTQIGERFPRVEFEDLDITQRKLTVSLYGPWGDENAPVYLRVDMRFPKAYPRDAIAKITVQKTNSVSDSVFSLLSTETQTIAETYSNRRRGCIEAVLRYLLRDQSLEQAISLAADEPLADSKVSSDLEIPGDLSSDDDDDQIQAPVELLNASNANVRVPLAKACGALWSDNGKLVCFFPPKVNQPLSMINFLESKDPDQLRSVKMFEGFGRLHTGSPGPRTITGAKTDDENSDNSDASESSSSGSSESSDEVRVMFSGFVPHKAWNRNTMLQRRSRSAERSNRSMNGFGQIVDPARTNIVSIHSFEDLIPSKSSLALGYRIFGNGPDVCDHNALIALQKSDEVAASVWHLAKLILQNNVPLECFYDEMAQRDIITLARKATHDLSRKDSGIDLRHDFKSRALRSLRPGRVRWGNSPLGPAYLVPALFHHFEIKGDVQMLAMLSCIFAEPRASSPELALREDENLSIELQAPAFSVDYYPSVRVARSLTASESNPALMFVGRAPPTLPIAHAVESSSSEAAYSNGVTVTRPPFTPAGTPPGTGGISRQNSKRLSRVSSTVIKEPNTLELPTTNSVAFSTSISPEESRSGHRSNSGLAFSFSRASLTALQQTYSSSPPPTSSGVGSSQKSHSPSGSLVPSGWSTTGIFGSSSGGRGTRTPLQASAASSDEQRSGHLLSSASFTNLRNPRRSGTETPDVTQRDWKPGLSTVESSSTKTVNLPKKRRPRVAVTLHNQDKFDEDGYASVPLLDTSLEWKYKSYRASYAHLLGVWELYPQMAEVLKFDGLIGYFAPKSVTNQELSLGDARRRKTMTEKSAIAAAKRRGLEVRRCCRECGKSFSAIEKNGIPVGWQCTTPGCSTINQSSMREICVICNKRIDGLMVPCLQCGHSTCYECAQGWFGPPGEPVVLMTQPVDDEHDEDSTFSSEQACPSGCGCHCASLEKITVPDPPEPEHNPEQEIPTLDRQHSKVSYRSERLMSQHGPDKAIGAFLSMTRNRSVSAARETAEGERHEEDPDAIFDEPVTPGTDDELSPWSKSNFPGLGRGIGGGLSQGLSSKSSEATIRKSTSK